MLFDELKKANMLALKNKDNIARSILSVVINKAMLVKIEKRTTNEELVDDDVLKVISKTIKELEEEINAFTVANRFEKVEELVAQKNVLTPYLPSLLTDDEILTIINSLDDKSMPSIMKHFKLNYPSRVDMKKVNMLANSINNK